MTLAACVVIFLINQEGHGVAGVDLQSIISDSAFPCVVSVVVSIGPVEGGRFRHGQEVGTADRAIHQ